MGAKPGQYLAGKQRGFIPILIAVAMGLILIALAVAIASIGSGNNNDPCAGQSGQVSPTTVSSVGSLTNPKEQGRNTGGPKVDTSVSLEPYIGGEIKNTRYGWPNFIVLHNTGGGGGARELVAEWKKYHFKGYTQFVIERSGVIHQLLPETKLVAGAAGFNARQNNKEGVSNGIPPGAISISIENVGCFVNNIYCQKIGGVIPFTQKQVQADQALVIYLMKKWNIPKTHIVSHEWIENNITKNHRRDGDPGDVFMQAVLGGIPPDTPGDSATATTSQVASSDCGGSTGVGGGSIMPGLNIDTTHIFDDSTNIQCAAGTTEIGIFDGWHGGNKTRVRVCAISSIPGNGEFSVDHHVNKVALNARISAAAQAMGEAMKKDGVQANTISGYRTYAKQEQLRRDKGRQAAKAGYSNHQMGLAIDFQRNRGSCSGGMYNWLQKNASRFGFKQLNTTNECHHWSVNGR